jgi:hypothetical protein
MVEKRVEIVEQEVLEEELRELNEIDGVVDHPDKTGTKDIADAVVGSAYNCYKHTKSSLLHWS